MCEFCRPLFSDADAYCRSTMISEFGAVPSVEVFCSMRREVFPEGPTYATLVQHIKSKHDGHMVAHTAITINNCPFCGQNLAKEAKE